jgi:hypothetical protein
MVSFRRLALGMALLAIIAGIAVAEVATPAIQCQQYDQQTARLRQESQTELLPALTFSCTVYNQLANSSSPIQAGTLYDWEVLFPLNAPITNSPAILGGATEPQLTVEVVRHGSTTAEGTATFYATKLPAPGGIYPGSASSGGAVIFPQVNMNPAGDHSTAAAADTVFISVDNLRASALGLASTPPNYGGPLVLTIWAKPSQTRNSANLTNPGNIFVGINGGLTNEQPTIAVQLGYAAPSLQVTEVSAYIPPPPPHVRGYHDKQSTGSSNVEYFGVDFAELYSYAFAPPVDGWESPSKDGGTRLAFVFSSGGDNGWPSFIDLFVPATIEVRVGATVVVVANYVQSPNADGSGGKVMPTQTGTFSLNSTFLGLNAAAGAYSSPQWVNITGTTLVVYEIAAVPPALQAVTTTLEVPVKAEIVSTPTIYPPPDDPSAQVTIVMAGYAPWTYPPTVETAPVPRFAVPPPVSGSLL